MRFFRSLCVGCGGYGVVGGYDCGFGWSHVVVISQYNGISKNYLRRDCTVQPPPFNAYQYSFFEDSGGFGPSIANLYLAGIEITNGSLDVSRLTSSRRIILKISLGRGGRAGLWVGLSSGTIKCRMVLLGILMGFWG